MRIAPVLSGLAALGGFLVTYLVRHYPWPLAFVTGLTLGAFAHAGARTIARMREQLQPRDDLAFDWSARGASARLTPGKDDHGAGQEEVHPRSAQETEEKGSDPGREEGASHPQPR